MQGIALTNEQLRMAAEARYMARASWEETAKAAGCVSATIRQYEYDGDPRWIAAIEAVVKIMRQRGLPVAYTCLLEQAEAGDVSAAKALLDRCEGAVTQPLDLTGKLDVNAKLNGNLYITGFDPSAGAHGEPPPAGHADSSERPAAPVSGESEP